MHATTFDLHQRDTLSVVSLCTSIDKSENSLSTK
jgi:hypothetical protein